MVAGEPLDYHLFAYLHMAAVSQTTGIELSVVVMRLYQVPLLLLFALQLRLGGAQDQRTSGGRPSRSRIVLFLGELDASLETDFLFSDLSFFWLLASHTFLFGLIFFVPAIVILADLLARERSASAARVQRWGALGGARRRLPRIEVVRAAPRSRRRADALRAGTSCGSGRSTGRRSPRSACAERCTHWRASSCSAGTPVARTSTRSRHSSVWRRCPSSTTSSRTSGVSSTRRGFTSRSGRSDSSVSRCSGSPCFSGTAVAARVAEIWFACLFAAGLPALLLLDHPGYSHFFIVFYGVVPGAILAGMGFTEFWTRHGRASLTVASVGAVGVVAWAVVTWHVSDTPIWPGLILAGILVAGGALARGSLGARQSRDRRSLRRSGVAAIAGCALFLGALNTPLDWLPTLSERASAGRPLYSQEFHGITAGLYYGLRWVHDSTPTDAVLVVNNHSLRPDGSDSKYFYYSAFAERRVVLESWDYTPQTAARGVFSLPEALSPFPRRLRLSNAVFADADPQALLALVCDYGATHLVVDKAHGSVSPKLRELDSIGDPVYSNWDLDVYEIRDGRPC